MLVPLGALYIDLVVQETSTTTLQLIDRDPEPDSPLEEELGAPLSTSIRLTIAAMGSAAVTAASIYVRVNGGAEVLAFSSGPPTFHATYAGSSFAEQMSLGSTVVDEYVFELVRATAFASQDVVDVRVEASADTGATLNEAYTFQIEDLTAPAITEVFTRGLRRLRVCFDEPVEQGTGTRGDARLLRVLTSGVEFVAPDRLTTPNGNFTSGDVGLYVGSARCAYAVNNGYFQIAALVDSRTVQLDRSVVAEFAPSDAVVTLTPYRLAPVAAAAGIVSPAFSPIVMEIEAVPSKDLVPGVDAAEYVDLVLQDDLTPARTYTLQAEVIDDVLNNTGTDLSKQFTSEPLPQSVRQRYALWDLIPEFNKTEDTTQDLERFIRCCDEVFQLIRSEVDGLLRITDIDAIGDVLLDTLLAHLGNPYTFELSAIEKRRLAAVLEEMYRDKGVEVGIEAALLFFLGIPMDVQPFTSLEGLWILGEGSLGETTMLGPGTSFLRYAFQVVSPTELTETQRFRVTEIVDYLKPAHTHFVALLEPSTGTPPTPTTFWVLGESSLGESTVLDD